MLSKLEFGFYILEWKEYYWKGKLHFISFACHSISVCGGGEAKDIQKPSKEFHLQLLNPLTELCNLASFNPSEDWKHLQAELRSAQPPPLWADLSFIAAGDICWTRWVLWGHDREASPLNPAHFAAAQITKRNDCKVAECDSRLSLHLLLGWDPGMCRDSRNLFLTTIPTKPALILTVKPGASHTASC
jgi:hypothetical protein